MISDSRKQMSKNNRTSVPMNGVVVPMAYLLVVLLLDLEMSRTTVTPLFGIIGLLVFSFRLRPSVMAFWAAVYSVVVTLSFMNSYVFHLLNREAAPMDDLTPIVRSATFVAGAILSVLYCRLQDRLKLSNAGLTQMLEKVPVPVITSDQDGVIHFANEAAASVAGLPSGELKGKSFFDLFADKNRQGATIADYLRRFSSPRVEEPLASEKR